MNKKIIWGIIIAVVIIGAGSYTYMYFSQPTYDKNHNWGPDTSDWETYTNEKYGFEFKYPTAWSMQSEESPILNQKIVSFSFQTPKPIDTLILFSIVLYPKNEWVEIKNEFQKPNGRAFTELIANNSDVFVALLPSPYLIPKEYKTEYDAILSTFKFTK
ncbi:MAG: PsbP-related protein [Candidatus Paceibacterota bacterium]|jgi:hypothetical protein